jgi:uncharacterized protein (TIGR02147 family)
MKSKQLPNIFEYIDYRKYLNDYYRAKKCQEPGFSHSYICYKLGQDKSKTLPDWHDEKDLSLYPAIPCERLKVVL